MQLEGQHASLALSRDRERLPNPVKNKHAGTALCCVPRAAWTSLPQLFEELLLSPAASEERRLPGPLPAGLLAPILGSGSQASHLSVAWNLWVEAGRRDKLLISASGRGSGWESASV